MLINNKDYIFGDAPKYRPLPPDTSEVSEDIVTYTPDDDEHLNPIKCKVLRKLPSEGVDKNLTSDMFELQTLIDNQIPVKSISNFSMSSDVFPDSSQVVSALESINVSQSKPE